MKYDMLHNTGALQEGLQEKAALRAPAKRKSISASFKKIGVTSSLSEMDDSYNMPVQLANAMPMQLANAAPEPIIEPAAPIVDATLPADGRPREPLFFAGDRRTNNAVAAVDQRSMEIYRQERQNMFFYTIPEGEKVLVTDKHGKGQVLSGPKRICRIGKRIRPLQHYIAYPGEFLIVKLRDGSQSHLAGPREEWLDPRLHSQIEKSDALQIAGKEAVVVYAKGADSQLTRRVINGPALFVPNPGEWLHTFNWHGNKDGGYKKVPGGLVFQKLWMMPDQMYHDVEDVCTSDDVGLTIKLMIFFELVDVDKMLENSHDPIGDFINATSSDVIDLVGRYSFDDFKQHTDKLNDLHSYPQLLNRAEQVGYRIHKIVYRGYATGKALQGMQEQAIEARTRLKLERETTEQAQKLADFKQTCEFQRLSRGRQEEKEQIVHELDKQKLKHQQEMEIFQQKRDAEYGERGRSLEQQREFLARLKEMGVDLTAYLTQNRADQVIELRGDANAVAPHLHLANADKNNLPPKA